MLRLRLYQRSQVPEEASKYMCSRDETGRLFTCQSLQNELWSPLLRAEST